MSCIVKQTGVLCIEIVFYHAGFVEPLRGAVMDASLSSIKQDHLRPLVYFIRQRNPRRL